MLVRPSDALLCRWLTQTPDSPPVHGTVLVVTCGEASTTLAVYRVDREPGKLAVTPGPGRHVAAGTGPWTAGLAQSVLDRCREGVPASSLLPLLDGVQEFGALLRTQPAQTEVRWAGPLAERMFEPLRLTRRFLAGESSVTEVTMPTGNAADRLLADAGAAGGAGGAPAAIVVGGIGAVWPFTADALATRGPVWTSTQPELDLAAGAAWWVGLRRSFAAARVTVTTEAAPRTAIVTTPHQSAVAAPERAEIPPWKRTDDR
jgi:hypothetical protein